MNLPRQSSELSSHLPNQSFGLIDLRERPQHPLLKVPDPGMDTLNSIQDLPDTIFQSAGYGG